MSALGLGLGLGLGAHRKVDRYGNMPATFTIPAGYEDTGMKYINFSEPVTVTITGDVTLSIDGTEYTSGATIPVATGAYHTLVINNPGEEAGTITFGKRKQIKYLRLQALGSSVITSDITGMKLAYLYLENIGSSVITGDITGMELAYLRLVVIGLSVITGEINGINDINSLSLHSIGSSLTYGTNLVNITGTTHGIQITGNTVFATAAEYERLINDAATGTWDVAHPFRIDAGTKDTDPGWDTVKADVATLLKKAAWAIIPSAWLSANGGSWPADWNEYEGE